MTANTIAGVYNNSRQRRHSTEIAPPHSMIEFGRPIVINQREEEKDDFAGTEVKIVELDGDLEKEITDLHNEFAERDHQSTKV